MQLLIVVCILACPRPSRVVLSRVRVRRQLVSVELVTPSVLLWPLPETISVLTLVW